MPPLIVAMSPNSPATEAAQTHSAPRSARPGHHIVILVLCTGAIVGAFVLGINNSDHIATPWLGFQLPSVCQFRNVTGLDCPGCGLTRAFVSIAHGRITQAWNYNGASLVVFAFVLLQIPYRTLQIWRIRSGRNEVYLPRITGVILTIVVGAMFVQWIAKMVIQFW